MPCVSHYILQEDLKHNGPLVTEIPTWSGQFWANYSPILPAEIIIMVYHHHHHTVVYNISILRSFTLVLSNNVLYVTRIESFLPGDSDSQVIHTNPPLPPHIVQMTKGLLYSIGHRNYRLVISATFCSIRLFHLSKTLRHYENNSKKYFVIHIHITA
jgi:hypothetical protein